MKAYKSKVNKDISHVLLESLDEVIFYLNKKDIFWEQSFNIFNNMNKWEEATRSRIISHSNHSNVIVSMSAVQSAIFKYKIPVSANVVNDFYNKGMIDFFSKKNNIFVNRSGGYCYIEAFNIEDDFDLVGNFSLDDFFNQDNYSFNYITNENKILIFENDPTLDPFTVNYFKDETIPYLCNLRDLMATDKFDTLCSKFVKYYSKRAFIYTTGSDYDQMLDYTLRAVKAGFNDFQWIFNDFDLDKEIEFREFLNEIKDIKYTIEHV